jgi:hypothetical protein
MQDRGYELLNTPYETDWKIAEGSSTVALGRQEAADRDPFAPSWPPSDPLFRDTFRFSNQFLHHQTAPTR